MSRREDAHAPDPACEGCRELFLPAPYRCCRYCDTVQRWKHLTLARWYGSRARWYRWRAARATR